MSSALYLAGGIALLFFGGEALVRGAVALARRVGISALLVGMTVVAAGTSAPELVVSTDAALAGKPALALGNVVGSNIANVLLILGISALIRPMHVDKREVHRDLVVLLLASVALAGLMATGFISRPAALLLLVAQVAYVVVSYGLQSRAPAAEHEALETEMEEEIAELAGGERPLWMQIAYVVAGVGVLVVGSRLLVIGATDLALQLGVSETVIGLTLVAVGTSLPELATSTVAAFRGHSDVAVGNVIGSNIFNSLLIVGVAAGIAPLDVPAQIAGTDGWIMLAVAVGAAALLWRGRLGRIGGGVLLAFYAAYLINVF